MVTDTARRITKYCHRLENLQISLKVVGTHYHAFTDTKQRENNMVKLR